LGLAIIRKLVLENGGEIRVFSEPDEFTEFKIKLPLNQNNSVDSNAFELETELDSTIGKSVLFETGAFAENFIIADFLEKNGITLLTEKYKADCADFIIIDSRLLNDYQDYIRLKNKKIVFLFSNILDIRQIFDLPDNDFYFFIQPLGIDELFLLLNFINNNSGLPRLVKKN